MTTKERFLTALNGGTPDRVSVQFELLPPVVRPFRKRTGNSGSLFISFIATGQLLNSWMTSAKWTSRYLTWFSLVFRGICLTI